MDKVNIRTLRELIRSLPDDAEIVVWVGVEGGDKEAVSLLSADTTTEPESANALHLYIGS